MLGGSAQVGDEVDLGIYFKEFRTMACRAHAEAFIAMVQDVSA